MISGTKKRFLGWIGYALKRRQIEIPEDVDIAEWDVSSWFPKADAGDKSRE